MPPTTPEIASASAARGTAAARGASTSQSRGRQGTGDHVPAPTVVDQSNGAPMPPPITEMRILLDAMQAQFLQQQEAQRMHGSALERLVEVISNGQQMALAQGASTAAAPSSAVSTVSSDVGDKRSLSEKHFRRVDKFQAGESMYVDWRDDMMNCLRAANSSYTSFLEVNCKGGAKPEDVKTILLSESMDMRNRDAEFCQILKMLTTGEAKTLLRDQDTGVGCWLALQSVYARNTLARALRMHREVLNPGQAKTCADIISMANAWWSRVQTLEKDMGKLPVLIKIAGLTEMCTMELRTQIYAKNIDLSQLTESVLEDLRQFVLSYAANQAASNQSILPVGNVEDQSDSSWPRENWDPSSWDQGDERDINMMGNCYACGGKGHPARLCPSKGNNKGGGKGEFRKGQTKAPPGGFKGYPLKGQGYGGRGTVKEKVTRVNVGRVAKLDTKPRNAEVIRGSLDMWQRGRREGIRRR